IPPEILRKLKTPKAILEYYFQNLEKQDRREFKQIKSSVKRLNEVKVLLVGEAKVGKTSLVKQLVDKTFNPNERKTEGIDIRSCFISVKNEKVKLNLWDFGGQEIMHATHQFFLTKRSLYLLVLDARRDETGNRLEYWLKIIESFSDNSPVIVVGNQVDQHPLDIDRRGLKKKYPNIKAFVETSCKECQGFSTLIRRIKTQVSNLEHVFDQIPRPWIIIKKKLEKLDKDYISYNSYARLCAAQKITNGRHQKVLIGFLHDLGIVLNFQDDPRLQHDNILNPEWVTTAVYKILNDHALMIDHRGILERQMLNRILDQSDYPIDKHSFILDIMQKFELCFLLEGYSGERYLLPDLLTKEEPETGDWSKALSVRHQYNVLPGSIISRFIVRMNQLVSKRTYWRNGVVLRKGDNKALVKADREERIISIFVIGNPGTRRHLIESIRDQLDYIHDTIPSIQVNEQISLPEQPDIWIDYRHLLTLESMGEQEWIPTGYDQKVNIKALLRGIETEVEHQAFPEVAASDGKKIRTSQSSGMIVRTKRLGQSQNPWSSGFFYLFSLSVIATVFAAVSHFVAWYILPVVIVGTLLAIGIVGALQLRQDNRFSEENFLILLIEAYKQLPFLPRYQSERDSEE
ncbi:MAG: COR domain-containing protein, partial [Cyanobacteria bacterium P01_B01_bin.77]